MFFLLLWTSQVCQLQFPHSQEQEGFYRSPTPVVCLAYTTVCHVTDKLVAFPTSLHHTLIYFPLHPYSVSVSFSIWSIYEMLHFSFLIFLLFFSQMLRLLTIRAHETHLVLYCIYTHANTLWQIRCRPLTKRVRSRPLQQTVDSLWQAVGSWRSWGGWSGPGIMG